MGNDFGKAFKVKGKIGGRWNKKESRLQTRMKVQTTSK